MGINLAKTSCKLIKAVSQCIQCINIVQCIRCQEIYCLDFSISSWKHVKEFYIRSIRKMSTNYARKMAVLRARIFGELVRPTTVRYALLFYLFGYFWKVLISNFCVAM